MGSFEHYGGTIGNDKALLEYLEDKSDSAHPGNIPETDDEDEVRAWFQNYIHIIKTYRKKQEIGP